MEGLWIISDASKEPDVVIYYAHGKLFMQKGGRALTLTICRWWICNGFQLLLS
jgi:hypothetical protein